MATNDFVELTLPEAQLLADLASASYDLERAREFAGRLGAALAIGSRDSSLVEPLTIAALVQYCRPFTSGKRMGVRDRLLSVLDAGQRDKHDWFRNVRDKHIAHSVNTFEESRATARYWVEKVEAEGITSIGYSHNRVIGIGKLDADRMVALSAQFLGYLGEWIKAEQAHLLKFVRGIPIEKVLAVGRGVHEPDFDNPQRPRS